MKKNISKTIFLLVIIMLTACVPAGAATQAARPTVPPTTELPYHPLNTLTNIPEIDVIITAVARGDAQQVRDLFEYQKLACMNVNALGGPPACRADEAEGTLVEVLPVIGSEGSFLHKEAAGNFPGLDVTGLYAVYRVPASTFSDENYPAGDYGIAYVSDGDGPEVILQVTDGKIVRIDYVFGFPESNDILPQGVTDFILEPVAK